MKLVSLIKKIIVKICFAVLNTNKKIILFVSFAGKKYDGSPRVIYEKMLEDERFKNYKFIWAFENPDKFNMDKASIIKIYSLKYYYYALKTKCWITNISADIGGLMKKNTLYFNTWHGSPIKKTGYDIENTEYRGIISSPDIMCAQANYDADILSQAYKIDREKIIITGLPRNDILANYNEEIKLQIINKLGLPIDKKIILYCPTWREYDNQKTSFTVNQKINFKEWENKIGEKYIILYRSHINTISTIEHNKFVYDFCKYECLNDLMIVSDILISDYSSIYIDYSIMGKPMLCFAYDYEKYVKNIGMYIDIRKELPCEIVYDEDTLLKQILYLDYEKMSHDTLKFRDKYVESFGNATNICVNKIWESIK